MKYFLTLLLAVLACLPLAAQESFPAGTRPASTTISMKGWPRIDNENRVYFGISAPEATHVIADICNKKYELQRDEKASGPDGQTRWWWASTIISWKLTAPA